VRIMAANVLGTNRNSAGFLKLVRENDPDILVTLESNAWWEERLSVLESAYPETLKWFRSFPRRCGTGLRQEARSASNRIRTGTRR
jgi:endonuclease/exonuclease/phosphatase (EEP) superfamily protein YafD